MHLSIKEAGKSYEKESFGETDQAVLNKQKDYSNLHGGFISNN